MSSNPRTYNFLSNLAEYARNNPVDADSLAQWLTNQTGTAFRRSSGNGHPEFTPGSVTTMANMQIGSKNTSSFQPVVQITHVKAMSQGKCLILSDGNKSIPALLFKEEHIRLADEGIIAAHSFVTLNSFERTYKRNAEGQVTRPALRLHEIQKLRSEVSWVIGCPVPLENERLSQEQQVQQEQSHDAFPAPRSGPEEGNDASSNSVSNSQIFDLLSRCGQFATESPNDPDVLAKLWSNATGGEHRRLPGIDVTAGA